MYGITKIMAISLEKHQVTTRDRLKIETAGIRTLTNSACDSSFPVFFSICTVFPVTQHLSYYFIFSHCNLPIYSQFTDLTLLRSDAANSYQFFIIYIIFKVSRTQIDHFLCFIFFYCSYTHIMLLCDYMKLVY